MTIQERLIIKNFFSVKDFDWEIRDFNILTGGMASGKSMCVKLLYFLEKIMHTLIFYQNITKEDLEKSVFLLNIEKEFAKLFNVKGINFSETEINYTYSYNSIVFDLKANWSGEENRLSWSSHYLNNHLQQWQSFFENGQQQSDKPLNTPLDKSHIVCNQIYEAISNEFGYSFPVGTMFIPASRAIATITDNTDFPDPFIVDFIKILKRFVLRFDKLSNEDINNILQVKNMKYDRNDGLRLTLLNEQVVTPLYLSSGQQELLYMLLLIGHLDETQFTFASDSMSIFDEEPCAHLFPQEQKDSIEYIVNMYRHLKEQANTRRVRFFITTHSPYILNAINNMLKKGYVNSCIQACTDTTLKEELEGCMKSLSFPHLTSDEISAYFIEKNGEAASMLSGNSADPYLYEEKIEDISHGINEDYLSIKDLQRRCKNEEV